MYSTEHLKSFIKESSKQIKNYTNVKNYVNAQSDIPNSVVVEITSKIDEEITKRKIQIEVFENILSNVEGLSPDPMLYSEIGTIIVDKLPEHIQSHALKLLNNLQ
jgi:hypothetical protein